MKCTKSVSYVFQALELTGKYQETQLDAFSVNERHWALETIKAWVSSCVKDRCFGRTLGESLLSSWDPQHWWAMFSHPFCSQSWCTETLILNVFIPLHGWLGSSCTNAHEILLLIHVVQTKPDANHILSLLWGQISQCLAPWEVITFQGLF